MNLMRSTLCAFVTSVAEYHSPLFITLLSLPSDFRVAYAANISEHLTIR